MIFYFPFTYLPEPLIRPLTGILGPLTILQPLAKQIPTYMNAWVDRGALHSFTPACIDAVRLEQAIQRFTSWAALHGGKPGDLKRFFQTVQGAGAWLQGPPTAEIRTQLRSGFQEKVSTSQDDPFSQATLFLSLAHMFDEQQDALARDLSSVRSLEERFGEILGEPSDRKTVLGPDVTTSSRNGFADPGVFMTTQRLQAWARVACACEVPATLFVTTSRAVWDLFCDDFPEAIRLLKVNLSMDTNGPEEKGQGNGEWIGAVTALAIADDPCTVSLSHLGAREGSVDTGASISLSALVGLPPHAMLARYLSPAPSASTQEVDNQTKNTLVAYIDATALLG